MFNGVVLPRTSTEVGRGLGSALAACSGSWSRAPRGLHEAGGHARAPSRANTHCDAYPDAQSHSDPLPHTHAHSCCYADAYPATYASPDAGA